MGLLPLTLAVAISLLLFVAWRLQVSSHLLENLSRAVLAELLSHKEHLDRELRLQKRIEELTGELVARGVAPKPPTPEEKLAAMERAKRFFELQKEAGKASPIRWPGMDYPAPVPPPSPEFLNPTLMEEKPEVEVAQ